MPSRTERIISYLPGTFSAFPRPSALYSFVDSFGNELLLAENSLAALMSAHWVDFADRNAELIDDLACMARLYGLAPRGSLPQETCGPLSSEETVEEFREHLKRYVRTFLEGTVTVQGVLRVVAEVLGLRIADDYADLDAWWTRRDDGLTTIEPRGDDAARSAFGFDSAVVNGENASRARFTGNRDLSDGVNLSGASVLHFELDGDRTFKIDLAAKLGRTSVVTLEEITSAINSSVGASIASHDGHLFTLSSVTVGPLSQLDVFDTSDDAAPLLLSLALYLYHGTPATGAQLTGSVDLSDGADLSEERYLRLFVDSKFLKEVDCAGADPARTQLAEITQAINHAFGFALASHDGHFLQLTSPTSGFNSSVGFQTPAAQDARARLFGPVASFTSGRSAQPAEVVGTTDLSGGVDLSLRAKLRIRLDGQPALIVDCTGNDPSHTSMDEIIVALNTRLGAGTASHDSRFIHLQSPTTGPEGTVEFIPLPPEIDAMDIIFGIGSRTASGSAATRARLVGQKDLRHGLDTAALNIINVALDGSPPVEINLRRGAHNEHAVTLEELRANINAALGAEVASHDNRHLILTSPSTGSASRIALEPLLVTRRRRFVTRAFITDEAGQAIFGFITRASRGEAATKAVVPGTRDLSRGVDLREASFIRLTVDDWPTLDIDCSGIRPRATTLEEIVAKINDRLSTLHSSLGNVARASSDGQTLLLVSPIEGSGSRLAFSPPRVVDALAVVLGLEPQRAFGSDATSVRLVGTADLRDGIDLSAAEHIKLRIDDRPPVEIKCANQSDPSKTLVSDITLAINLAFGEIVALDSGGRVLLTSLASGEKSRVELLKPDGPDATVAIFGITPTRKYQGRTATPARLVGTEDLHAGKDLRVARLLTLAVNGGQPLTVDCASRAADARHTTLDEIVLAINDAFHLALASHDGSHLILTSPAPGSNSQLELLTSTGNDAREKLFGEVPSVTQGIDAAPAVIEGQVDLLAPLDLTERRMIRLSVDGALPLDVDIAGQAPGTTTLDEIIQRINTIFPQMASATAENHLRLTSNTHGVDSSLSLLPMRVLELIEYPPAEASDPPPLNPDSSGASTGPITPTPRQLRHGDRWFVNNNGASHAELEIVLSAPHGTFGSELVNHTNGQRIRLLSVLRPGERAIVRRDAEGHVQASIISSDGESRPVPPDEMIAGPLGVQVFVPFKDEQQFRDGTGEKAAALQLNHPPSKALVLLRARKPGPEGNLIRLSVTEARLAEPAPEELLADGSISTLTGRVRGDKNGFHLADANGKTVARLRAGPGVALEMHLERVAMVLGPLHPSDATAPLMVVEEIEDLFDVTFNFEPPEGEPLTRNFTAVIGTGEEDPRGIVWQINHAAALSKVIHAEEALKSAALTLPRGRSSWAYFDCYGARFDLNRFDVRFAGGHCIDRAVFDFSRFNESAKEADTDYLATVTEAAVFAAANVPDPPVEVSFRWMEHQPGAFVVNLPLELPESFGARFNFTRIGMADTEVYEGVFTEPEEDNPNHFGERINLGPKMVKGEKVASGSTLLKAEVVDRVPLDFEVITIPFRKPRRLTGGNERRPAQMYLAEKGLTRFIKLSARAEGAWGNAISVAARKAGPARFDVTVDYAGARFENARVTALGGAQLPSLTEEILRPGPAGVLQAKAAGVKAQVSRDGADSQS